MIIKDIICEGGWDSTVTQSTVINPTVIKQAVKVVAQFTQDFNSWAGSRGQQPITMGRPLGSGAYHEIDPEYKVYGDIDLQMIADIPSGLTKHSQFTSHWNKLIDEFIVSQKPKYVHYEGKPTNGHVIFNLGNDQYVQVDMLWTSPGLAQWAQYRTTPERNVKGSIHGNLFSTLGEIMGLSIQHAGVQMKTVDGKPVSFSKQKGVNVETLTKDISRFVLDILTELYKRLGGSGEPKVDPLLKQYPGVNINDVRSSDLINAIKGLARSFELNNMYGKYNLEGFTDANDFIAKFIEHYKEKTLEALNATKYDKASSPEALQRVQDTKDKLTKGFSQVVKLFKEGLDMNADDQMFEDFTGGAKPGSRPGSLKRKASQYLGKGAGDDLTKGDLRRLAAKANKMKNSEHKAERQRGNQLAKQVSWANNFGVAKNAK